MLDQPRIEADSTAQQPALLRVSCFYTLPTPAAGRMEHPRKMD